ncbi:flavin reductase (DIM6/NTAB) family NADH-FMN oxidoreductase RutF [Neobacillus niacini]|uniref:flavin reductase family protein n=1 Tax=Neobacillus niacini TaxID=86668 RepID=UPI0027881B90|nr:flavin reductase family protein [Neobacillus niacini]MDQ1005206.1 flavin reductase (DIM6/NTAB) family NADH-FMN oxidoreductase RutF [Neobacillus niacini]
MDSRTFRNAMGTFATGITVITTEVDGEVSGMTANAFMSVSLDPKLVLISIDNKAKMLEKIQKTKKYGISILSSDQQQQSMNFAGQIKERIEADFERVGDIPVLKGSLLNLSCNVVDIHKAGDHVLFIGEVTEMKTNEGDPLLYFGGKYRNLQTIEEKIV